MSNSNKNNKINNKINLKNNINDKNARHRSRQELPEKWSSMKKKSMGIKQQITPLISYEVGLLKKDVAVLEVKQNELREEFKSSDAFFYNCPEPYLMMDAVGLFGFGFLKILWTSVES